MFVMFVLYRKQCEAPLSLCVKNLLLSTVRILLNILTLLWYLFKLSPYIGIIQLLSICEILSPIIIIISLAISKSIAIGYWTLFSRT